MRSFRCPECQLEQWALAVECAHRCPNTGKMAHFDLIEEEAPVSLPEQFDDDLG
jgi:hypothetical protein